MQALTIGVHHKTPQLVVVDPRGLPIRSVDYWREVEGVPTQARVNRTLHNAAGFAIKQWDPRHWARQNEEPGSPATLEKVSSLSGNTLCTESVDAGWQLALPGFASEIVLSWDGRGTRREIEYDDLIRPVSLFEHNAPGPRRCVERLVYGRSDHDQNQRGQLIRHDDPAGTLLFELFSITGQCLKQIRHFTLEPIEPDWPEQEADRRRLLEPGEGAISQWSFGPLGDLLKQVDAKANSQAFVLTLDGRLGESRLQLKGRDWKTLVSDIHYNAEGKIERETAGNHTQTIFTYSPEDGRLMERWFYSERAGLLQHLFYVYDRMGNVLSIEDKALLPRYFANQRIEPISRFFYDSLSQLIKASGWESGAANQGPESMGRKDPLAVSNYCQTYSYDESGNLLKLTHVGAQSPGRELKAAQSSNRCLPWRNGVPPSEEEIAAAFDVNGNLLELDRGRWLTWNLRNQLQSVSPVERGAQPDDRESYLYDGSGQRVRKIRSLQTNARTVMAEVRYLPGLQIRTHSGTGAVLQVISVQTGFNPVHVLHWENAVPPGLADDQYRYSIVDHLNSCTLELADDARIISREIYYPFGDTAWSAGDDVIEVGYKIIRYSGKELDATGLYYYGLRYYIPWLQRWLNPDPAGAVDGLNLYWMTRNNPVSFIDDDGAITRRKLANGLWEPVIAAGDERERPGARRVDAGKSVERVPYSGKPISIKTGLSIPEFGRNYVSTTLFDPAKGGYSKAVSSGLANTKGGSSFIFSMHKMSYSGAAKGEFNALRIVDIPGGEIPDQANVVSGFWAPQGGYVDIPVNPSGSDPDHVFTPSFSGCSLTVDQLNDNVLRVRHVVGGKEHAQYNNLDDAEHGSGLSAAMEYSDYAFDTDENNNLVSGTSGFAFMKYDRSIHAWNIHYQVIQGAEMGMSRYSTAPRGWFGGKDSHVSVFERSKVRKTMTKQVITARKRGSA